ncbi:MAG: LPS assembly lipoprotein LptE [Neomegalonema sp.]|nr:LPS assembly lipoprotein LptE [Neomegalonema sp.]
MSLPRRSFVLGLAALSSGCGFSPIARQQAGSPIAFRSIDITTNNERLAYHLRRALAKAIRLSDQAPNTLLLRPVLVKEGLAIQQDDTISRFNLQLVTGFDVVVAAEPSAPSKQTGTVTSITALNATSSQFTTSTAERDAVRRLADDNARRILRQLQLNTL